jgi:hypothetical protein
MKEIDELLEDSEDGLSRMWYVDEMFEPLAEEAYQAIGTPDIKLEMAWIVFGQMVGQLADDAMNSPWYHSVQSMYFTIIKLVQALYLTMSGRKISWENHKSIGDLHVITCNRW